MKRTLNMTRVEIPQLEVIEFGDMYPSFCEGEPVFVLMESEFGGQGALKKYEIGLSRLPVDLQKRWSLLSGDIKNYVAGPLP